MLHFLVVGVILTFYFALLFCVEIDSQKKNPREFVLKILGYISIPYFVLGTLPIYQLLLYHTFCLTSSSYYRDGCSLGSLLGITNTIVAVIGLLMHTLLVLGFSTMLIDPNPFVKSSISSPLRSDLIREVPLKLFLPLMFQMLGGFQTKIMLWVSFPILLLSEIYNYVSPVSYKTKINRANRWMNASLIWITLTMCVCSIFENDLIDQSHSLYILGGLPLFIIISEYLSNGINGWWIARVVEKERFLTNVHQYLDMLCRKIQNFNNEETLATQQAILHYHRKGCIRRKNEGCVCDRIAISRSRILL